MIKLFLLIFLVSCSSNKSEKLSGSLTVIDSSNDIDKFLDERNNPDEIIVKESPVLANNYIHFRDVNNILTKKIKEYKVRSNETLMLIAFNIYGNFLYWKSIAELMKIH